MSFLRNAWYMIAWSEEVAQTPFSRTVLELPILVYRDPANGRTIAMLDRCPHRFAPLSMGVIKGSNIRCGYHGLEFDASGRCVRNPFSSAIPAAAKVRAFPVEEQDGVVWIWAGDAEAADPAKITRIAHHTDPQQRCVHGVTTAKADYRLLSDNLMDLSHAAFLHPAFGGETYAPKVTAQEEPDGTVLADFIIERMPNYLPPSELAGAFVHNHDGIRWIAPSTHLLESRVTSLDADGKTWINRSAHILTPETSQSTHYFWSSAVAADSTMSDEDHLAVLRQTFDNEDKPMVEAVQRRMGDSDLFDLNPVLLHNDTGGVRMRRRLSAMIQSEG